MNIKNNLWTINDAITLNENNTQKIEKNLLINTNFNYEKISNLYSDLSSITLWGLIKLKEDYQTVNYSTIEIDYQFQKILSYPIYLTIMSLLSIVMMMNLKSGLNRIFNYYWYIFISFNLLHKSFFWNNWQK